MNLMLFLEAWGKMIHEKNLKQKSRDTVLLTLLYLKDITLAPSSG